MPQPIDAALDSFQRSRVSSPHTLFDSKMLYDKAPLFWDEYTEDSDSTSVFDSDAACVDMAVPDLASGEVIRQTYQRFNYQPGKGVVVLCTGTLGGGGDGITSQMGLMDSNNGLFFQRKDGVVSVNVRSSASGSPVDIKINQSEWNLDDLTQVDFTKSQIFVIDFAWLGLAPVRFGVVYKGEVVYCPVIENEDADQVYMSTPNLPIRYRLANDGTGEAASMKQICSSVQSEGGEIEELGTERFIDTDNVYINAAQNDTEYALIGIRLKDECIDQVVKVLYTHILCATGDDYLWRLKLNPTISDSDFEYVDLEYSTVEIAIGTIDSEVTGGIAIAGGHAKGSGSTGIVAERIHHNARYLGVAIDGTRDTIVLCGRPITNGADFYSGIAIKELR